MTFEQVKQIYLREKKMNAENYHFVGTIFAKIKEGFKRRAQAVGKDPNQAWNSWSGHNLQKLIAFIIEDIVHELTAKTKFQVGITGDGELRRRCLLPELEQVKRNIVVFYDTHAIVPDADIILYDKRNSNIMLVLSCKASLRERVAQAAYWKLKLSAHHKTATIQYYLLSTDNDGDFVSVGEDISRDRIIVEYGEIDCAYIFRDVPTSNKVKRFDQIVPDLKGFFDAWFGGKK